MKLQTTDAFDNAHPNTLDRICNGCGPGSWKVDIVPDCILGVDVEAACNVHDFDYWMATSEADRERADRRLYQNLLILIEHRRPRRFGQAITCLRKRLAKKYYQAVRLAGGDHIGGGTPY